MPTEATAPAKVQLKVYVTPKAKQVLADYVTRFNTNQSLAVEGCINEVLAAELAEGEPE